MFNDHKPLIYAFRQHSDNSSPRQSSQLDFISQFTTEIFHIKGSENILADRLSRINVITMPNPIDYREIIARPQQIDSELQTLINNSESLQF